MIRTGLLDHLCRQARHDSVTQLVVGAVICHNDDVLLLKRPADDFMPGIHELPSGKVEAGESLDVALIREVKEETGLDVAAISSYLGSFDYTSGSGKKTRQFNFEVTVSSVEPVVLTEHDEYLWASDGRPAHVTNAVQDLLITFYASLTR